MIAANHPALELVSIKAHDNKIVPALINSNKLEYKVSKQ